MKIILNGEELELEDNVQSITDLINHYELEPEKVAIELNLEIVAKVDFVNIKLQAGDRIELIEFVGGG